MAVHEPEASDVRRSIVTAFVPEFVHANENAPFVHFTEVIRGVLVWAVEEGASVNVANNTATTEISVRVFMEITGASKGCGSQSANQ